MEQLGGVPLASIPETEPLAAFTSKEGGGLLPREMKDRPLEVVLLLERVLGLISFTRDSCNFMFSNPIMSGTVTSTGVSLYPTSLASFLGLPFKTSSKDFDLGAYPRACTFKDKKRQGLSRNSQSFCRLAIKGKLHKFGIYLH